MPAELRPVVEIGCDHGYICGTLDAIGTEKARHRLPRRPGRFVVADGLAPFSRVGVAVVAGMGARGIARILSGPCQPEVCVLHAQDRPGLLRAWCASHGWRIDAERLAPEGHRFAEVLRVVRGREPHEGLDLLLGPCLDADPFFRAHLEERLEHFEALRTLTLGRDARVATDAETWVRYLQGRLARLVTPNAPPRVNTSGPASR